MHGFKQLLLLLILVLPGKGLTDTLDNALALFDFAEANFPELLQPLAPEVQEIQGFYVRHYEETGIYLGIQGDNIWAFGAALGPDVVYVGKLNDLITLDASDITNLNLSNRRPQCTYYAESLFSNVRDIKRSLNFDG